MRVELERVVLPHFLTQDFTEEETRLLERIYQEGFISACNDDNANRTLLVGLQGKIERNITVALAQKQISAVVGVIHTALPPTPLRTESSPEMAAALVADSIKQDPKCLATVTNRADILRGYIAQGGRLIASYPASMVGLEISGIEMFNNLCNQYPDCLINRPHDFGAEDSGASYLIQSQEGQTVFFGIRANQANAPSGSISLWLDYVDVTLRLGADATSVSQTQVRFNEISEYLAFREVSLAYELEVSRDALISNHQERTIEELVSGQKQKGTEENLGLGLIS